MIQNSNLSLPVVKVKVLHIIQGVLFQKIQI